MKVSITNYDIETKDLDKKIVLLTDIHYYSKKSVPKLNMILDTLKKMTFDYVCIAGDFIDVGEVKELSYFIEWLNKLSTLSKVVMSIGGHDIIKSKGKHEYYYNEELYSAIKKIDNLYLLDNEVYIDNSIRFIGLTLPVDYYYKYKENTNYFKRYVNNTFDMFTDKYNILLCHTPVALTNLESYQDIKLLKNIDLTLSGHNHAGIVPLWLRGMMKGRGFFSPCGGKLFPKYSYGLVKRNNINIVISSGITKASRVNPFFFLEPLFDSEITMINLKKSN